MKVYTKIVYDKDDNIIEEHSYNYKGPVSQANVIKAAAAAKKLALKKASKKAMNAMDDAGLIDNRKKRWVEGKIKRSGGHWEFLDTSNAIDSVNGTQHGYTDVHKDEQSHGLLENPLHKFASYNTLFTLSGLSKDELDSLSYLKNSPHDIIARSSGIGDDPNVSNDRFDQRQEEFRKWSETAHMRGKTVNHKYNQLPSFNILSKGHDIFFEDVNILSTVGPNPERGLANFTKMEFQLHEPFGVTLVEKIRAACYVNYFDDYQDAPLLLTIEWKGWDEHGKHKSSPGSKALIRKIPILISRVAFDVDQGGAKYTCIAVPYGDLAFDDRFKFPRTLMNISASSMIGTNPKGTGNWTGWIGQMERALYKQMEDEKEENVRELNDTYRFIVHQDVLDYGKEWLRELQLTHHKEHAEWYKSFIGDPNLPKAEVKIDLAEGQIDLKTALPKFFEDAIRTLVGYQQLAERFWYTWGSMQLKKAGGGESTYEATLEYYKDKVQFKKDLEMNQYVDWFMIKPMVYTDTNRFDHIRKVHPKTITYYAMPTKIHILKFIKPGISFGEINWNKYVRKQYDYIYTGDNVDIQGLKIDYKSAYYMRNVRPYWKTKTSKGDYENFVEEFDATVKSVFGKEDYPEKLLPLRQEPSHIRGRSTVSSYAPTTHKSQEFYDYLTNPQADMMKIELEILGDPQYICQDIYTTLKKDGDDIYPQGYKGTYNERWGSFNAEQYQPLVKVNYRLPDEINERDQGVMFEKQLSYSENLFFNGVYQLTKVESRVNQGAFTQVLTLVRLNNQKGTGDSGFFIEDESFTKIFKDKKAEAEAKAKAIASDIASDALKTELE
tara:strand:+ start:553 stop:3051 length:2499 start_codon:yes stop_codon:yes gene_type:complete